MLLILLIDNKRPQTYMISFSWNEKEKWKVPFLQVFTPEIRADYVEF